MRDSILLFGLGVEPKREEQVRQQIRPRRRLVVAELEKRRALKFGGLLRGRGPFATTEGERPPI